MPKTGTPLRHRIDDQLFGCLYRRSLVYNACWEDPAVDREALRIGPRDAMLVISSAGCNVLDYALREPRVIHAVDANPSQTALLELKIAGVRHLDYQRFFALFGMGRMPGFRALYAGRLRAALSLPARRFWDRRLHWFEAEADRPGFYYRGLSGSAARLFLLYQRSRPALRRGLERLLECSDLEEQAAVFLRAVEPYLWTGVLRWVLDRQCTMNLLGVPAAQRDEIRRHQGGGVGHFVAERLRQVCTTLFLADNYFWLLYLRGHYTPTCCPEYLKPENFTRLKDGLVDRIRPTTTTVSAFLAERREPIDKFVLLDHMDWMADREPAALSEEWRLILERRSSSATVIFRSAAAEPRYLDTVAVPTPGGPRRLHEVLRFDRAAAGRLHRLDRVGTYGGFHIAYPVERGA